MATNNKQCQTSVNEHVSISSLEEYVQGMFDESVAVDALEVESSPSSEEDAVQAAMSKFNPPARHTARHDFDSESDSDSSPENFIGNISEQEQSPQRKIKSADKHEPKKLGKGSGGKSKQPKRHDSSNSDSESGEEVENRELVVGSGVGRKRGVVIPAEGAYDPKQFQDLKVPPEMENIFQYIMKYTPQKIELEARLRAFVPECVPAVGDCDALLKLSTPLAAPRATPLDEHVLAHIDNLGLTILDEPAAEQSEPALLHLQLRAISKTAGGKTTLTKKIEEAEKNPKAIERWIKDVSELHAAKPPPTVTYTRKMPDIDSLMEEWPEAMEEALNEVGFPPASLDCSLSQYVELVCALLDVPLHERTLHDRIQALHLLFSLYSAVKNSQLYAERQKEKEVEK
ncbi:unnamed protein product [Parnassius apollo]|uniref:Intraflagellar transport protein 46 homolog n=1 Tax=Parnassius apollo TaxID=110799 RepID=A0A8S3X6W8_PARAO|nr:unnamed protein product [Parnassius apollo]